MLVGQISRCFAWAFRLGMCLCVLGCQTIDGGAVELSWKLRPTSGSPQLFVDCDSGQPGTNPITGVRLDWQVGEQAGTAAWNCTDYHGLTGFDLPPGTAVLSVSLECASGPARTNTYSAPTPEQRTVTVGNTISLGAVELLVQTIDCSDALPCICR